MVKKLFMGIPNWILAVNAAFTIIWGIMNAYLTTALAKVTAVKIDGKEYLQAAIFFLIYIIVWEAVEFICDSCDGIQNAYVRNATYKVYYRKIYLTKPETLQHENTGYVAGILTQLIQRKESLMFNLLVASISIIYIIYLAIYIGFYSVWFSVMVLLLTAMSLAIRLICTKKIEKPFQKMTAVRGEQNRIFMDGINNIQTVQKLRALDFILKKNEELGKENIKFSKKLIFGNELGFTLYKALNYMLCPICMFIALALYEKDPQFPMVEFMAYLSIVTIQLVHNVRSIAAFIKDYGIFVTTQKEMDQLVVDMTENYTSTSIGTAFQEISLKNVNYHYTFDKNASNIIIDDFYMKKGECICIMGESGQGKTTLLKLLSGMIETDGKLLVDGKKTELNIDAVYIAQDTEMLDMTLRENLTLGKENITDQEIQEMIEAVGLKDWLNSQELGLNTLLGERGVFVSTGQRQRLNLIRGLLIDKEIYFLDEPTSNVDEKTEEKMIQLIKKKLAGKTVVIVTHKSKISHICDRKYLFEKNILKVHS